MKTLLVMAAGTGGHVIPGLAVADEMQRRGWMVSWLGTQTGIENRLVPKTGIVLDRVSFNGLRGKGLFGNVLGAMRLMIAFRTCSRLMARRRPDAVLGMGGYLCFPGGWMAWLHGLPLLLVNADATLLLSNKALLPAARRIAFGFDGDSARTVGKKGVVTGNPVRAAIEAISEPAARFDQRDGALRLLVVGGSLGARVLKSGFHLGGCAPRGPAGRERRFGREARAPFGHLGGRGPAGVGADKSTRPGLAGAGVGGGLRSWAGGGRLVTPGGLEPNFP